MITVVLIVLFHLTVGLVGESLREHGGLGVGRLVGISPVRLASDGGAVERGLRAPRVWASCAAQVFYAVGMDCIGVMGMGAVGEIIAGRVGWVRVFHEWFRQRGGRALASTQLSTVVMRAWDRREGRRGAREVFSLGDQTRSSAVRVEEREQKRDKSEKR